MSESQIKNSKEKVLLKKILVDETIFVEAYRANHALHDKLSMFLGQSEKRKGKRKYELSMAYISKQRLGMYLLYRNRMSVRLMMRRHERLKQAILKRQARAETADLVIQYFLGNGFWRLFFNGQLFDIFLCVNEAKAKLIEDKHKRKMDPSEIIPLEVCRIAQIAHRKSLPLLSFNKDFNYFCSIPIFSGSFIDYLDPDHFLLQDVKS